MCGHKGLSMSVLFCACVIIGDWAWASYFVYVWPQGAQHEPLVLCMCDHKDCPICVLARDCQRIRLFLMSFTSVVVVDGFGLVWKWCSCCVLEYENDEPWTICSSALSFVTCKLMVVINTRHRIGFEVVSAMFVFALMSSLLVKLLVMPWSNALRPTVGWIYEQGHLAKKYIRKYVAKQILNPETKYLCVFCN